MPRRNVLNKLVDLSQDLHTVNLTRSQSTNLCQLLIPRFRQASLDVPSTAERGWALVHGL